MKNIVVLSAARTPVGSFLGKLSALSAPALGSAAIRAALDRAGVKPPDVEQVIMGNVLQAGIGQAPARQASLGAGIPDTRALHHAPQGLRLGNARGHGRLQRDPGRASTSSAVAGGMESMSNAPYLLERVRSGYRMGNAVLVDSMIKDGLWDPYKDIHMGNCAEMCAGKYHFTREEQDAFALESYKRAQDASKTCLFAAEIAPVEVAAEEGGADQDRHGRGAVRRAPREDRDAEAGVPEGRHRDGGQRLEDQRRRGGARRRLRGEGEADGPRADRPDRRVHGGRAGARVVHDGARRRDPEAPRRRRVSPSPTSTSSRSTRRSPRSRWRPSGSSRLDPARVNIRGGAVALGHPIGASGARILTTLIHALRKEGKKRGMAAICIGGGEATAMLVETV